MKVALVLGEELLPDSADDWREDGVEYIRNYEQERTLHTPDESELIQQAISAIREAGLVRQGPQSA